MRWLLPSLLVLLTAVAVLPSERARAQSLSQIRKSSTDVKRPLNELAENVRRAVVELRRGDRSIALGTAVGGPGLVVSKASEVSGEGELLCRLWDEREFAAEILAIDETTDLALLRIATEALEPVDLSLEQRPNAGSLLIAVGVAGKPLGLGVVEVDSREFNLRQPRQSERIRLGLTCSPDEASGGLMVEQVTAESGARRAGIRRGDIIRSVDGNAVSTVDHLHAELRKYKHGDQVEVGIERENTPKKLQVTLIPIPVFEPYDQWGGGPFSKRRFGFRSVIAHDVIIAPSQCGGPMLDTEGRVVGINIARALRVASYAQPADVVREFVEANLPESKSSSDSMN